MAKFKISTKDLTRRQVLARKISPRWVTPHFRSSEFDCHDGTGYVEGLTTIGQLRPSTGRYSPMRRLDAYRRRRGLALRCEQVRYLIGGKSLKVLSAYRTPNYNEQVGGASNSAHVSGYAVDLTTDAVGLEELKKAVRETFEAGCGYYPSQDFVHGDYDKRLGYRNWEG